MKKALVVSALAGFIQTFLKHDIKLLQDMGYEVHCAGNASNKDLEENEFSFREINTLFHQVDFASKSPFSKDNIRAFLQIRALVKKEGFDVVHCHTPIPGVIVRLACMGRYLRGKTKVLYTTHGFYFHKGSDKKSWRMYFPIEKAMSRFSNAIVTINREDYENAKRMRCKNVYHINGVGVDTRKYREVDINRDEYRKSLGIAPDDLMILAIGELSKRKNHRVIIEAIAASGVENAVFAVCGKAISGSGTYDELEQLAKALGVRVRFLGHRSDIAEICHCADIGVMPSTREGLGLAGIEMLSAGVPLAASYVQGIKDYVYDDVNGYACVPNDAATFARALIRLSDPLKRAQMQSACIDVASRFDNSISYAQMKEIYEQIL